MRLGLGLGLGFANARPSAQALNEPSLPRFLLQAVVTLGPKVTDGRLILGVEPAWNEIAKLIAADPNALHQIPSEKMEQMIAGWYTSQGFNVTLTPRSGDHGRDVIAEKPGVLSVRIIDQVKAYKPEHLVDANDVRALLGVLQADRAASKGLVTTTSGFAPKIGSDPYIAPFMPYRLELVDGAELIRRLGAASLDE